MTELASLTLGQTAFYIHTHFLPFVTSSHNLHSINKLERHHWEKNRPATPNWRSTKLSFQAEHCSKEIRVYTQINSLESETTQLWIQEALCEWLITLCASSPLLPPARWRVIYLYNFSIYWSLVISAPPLGLCPGPNNPWPLARLPQGCLLDCRHSVVVPWMVPKSFISSRKVSA